MHTVDRVGERFVDVCAEVRYVGRGHVATVSAICTRSVVLSVM
jgi:hypothetical protein